MSMAQLFLYVLFVYGDVFLPGVDCTAAAALGESLQHGFETPPQKGLLPTQSAEQIPVVHCPRHLEQRQVLLFLQKRNISYGYYKINQY